MLDRLRNWIGFPRQTVTKDGMVNVIFGPSKADYSPNWFQLGRNMSSGEPMRNSIIYACVSIIAQEIARMNCYVWTRTDEKIRRQRLHPHLDKLLRKPNSYQTKSDFWLYTIAALLLRGNAYWLAEMKGGEVIAWHPVHPDSIRTHVNDTTGDVFYSIHQQPMKTIVKPDQLIPARYVAHLRMFCTTHPLIGDSPITAAGLSMIHNESIKRQSQFFWQNMARPSGVLTAPESIKLTEAEAAQIKERFASSSSEAAMGRPVVLGAGYVWTPLAVTAHDAELTAQLKLTIEDIARVFRMPMHMLGDLQGATFNNVSALQQSFIVQTLGFYMEHVQSQLDSFFNLGPDEYTEFDVEEAMLRPDFAARMEAMSKAIQGGVYSPNEARRMEHLPDVEGGEDVYLQAQMVPIRLQYKNVSMKPPGGSFNPGDPTDPNAPDNPDGSPPTPPAPATGSAKDLASAMKRRRLENLHA